MLSLLTPAGRLKPGYLMASVAAPSVRYRVHGLVKRDVALLEPFNRPGDKITLVKVGKSRWTDGVNEWGLSIGS